MGILKKIFSGAISLAIATGGAVAVSPAALAEDTGGSGAMCFQGADGAGVFQGNSFPELSEWLSGKFRKEGRVWQAPSNGAVFSAWCQMNQGEGELTVTSDGKRTVKPTLRVLEDGTRLGYRTTSRSGGDTIDINAPGRTKDFKVHVG